MLVQIFRKDGKPDGEIIGVEAIPRGGDYHGARMDSNAPVSKDGKGWDIPAETLDGREIITLQYINVNRTGGRRIIAEKPFTGVPDFKNGTIKYNVKPEDWFAIEDHLAANNMYIDGGVKIDTLSRGQLKEAIATNPNLTAGEQKILLNQYRSELRDNYNQSLQKEIEWFGDAIQSEGMEINVGKLHEKSWKSNVLWEAQRHGLYTEGQEPGVGFSRIGDLMNSKVGAKNVVDRNKREQMFHTKNIPLNFNINGKDTLNITVLKDYVAKQDEYPDMWYKTEVTNQDGTKEIKSFRYESATDGTIYIRQDVWNEIVKQSGFNREKDFIQDLMEDSGMLKPSIITKTDTGVMIGKSAGRKASDSMNEFMLENNLDVIVMGSAAKHKGGMREGRYDYIVEPKRDNKDIQDEWLQWINNPNYSPDANRDIVRIDIPDFDPQRSKIEFANAKDYIYNESKDTFSTRVKGKHVALEQLDIRQMPISDFRLDLGVYENPGKSTSPQMIVRQLFGNLNEEQHPAVVEHVFKTIYEPLINGDPKQNTKIENYIKDPSVDIDFNKLNIDQISLKNIHSILTSEGKELKKLRTHIRDHIMRVSTKREEGEADLNFTDDQWRDYIFRNKRIFHVVGTNDAVADGFKYTNKFWEHAYKRYMIDRYLRPKWKYSGKGWAAPYGPEEIKTSPVNTGEFMMDNGMKRFLVDFDPAIVKLMLL